MSTVTRLGLTGGIGSGKSTAAQMLADLGAAIIDADAIARSVTAPGGAAMGAIATAFGRDYVRADGALDRDRMRALAFADPNARQRLESIIHPLVGQETQQQARNAVAAGKQLVVFDIPLLVESGRWRERLDRVLVVDCSSATQIQRVMARSSDMTAASVERIIAAQAPRLLRLAAADIVICNDGISLDELRLAIGQVARNFGL